MTQSSLPGGHLGGDPRRAGYRDADLRRRIEEPAKSATLPVASHAGGRSEFARDRARVLHSGSFRRLAGKTQVVAPGEGAVPRTRLTHSLEVAQIARGIGVQLGCDPDLTDLAGLAHDIGHPPFGHNGEAALNAIGRAIGGFEANAQNLRLLTRLEPKIIGPGGQPAGLNLTRAALDAVIKYPWSRRPGGGKFGVYHDDEPIFGWLRATAPRSDACCLEAQVMDWADDVAYSVHDVEDGVSAGRIDLVRLAGDAEERTVVAIAAAESYSTESADDLAGILADLLRLPAVAAGMAAPSNMVTAAAFKKLTSELTGRFATGAVGATRAAAGDAALMRYAGDLVVPDLLAAEVAVLKAIAFHYVMNDPDHQLLQQRQHDLLAELVAALCDRGPAALDPIYAEMYRAAADDAARLRVVLDQVSLLTDAQAISRHRRLCWS